MAGSSASCGTVNEAISLPEKRHWLLGFQFQHPELRQWGIQNRASWFYPRFSPAHPYLYLPILATKMEASGKQVWGALRNLIKGNPNNSSGECFC